MIDFELTGKNVLVTGSSRGIGFGIAERFLTAGARVCLTGRNTDSLTKADTQLQTQYPRGQYVTMPTDFTVPSSIDTLKSRLSELWGGLDILVCNVGSGASVQKAIPDIEEFNRVMQLNFFSCVDTIRVFIESLQQSNGVVIVISSIAGLETLPAPTAYTVAKSSLNSFAKSLSRKFHDTGVRLNVVAPGNIIFEGGSWAKKLAENPEQVHQYLQQNVPMQRFGKPEEIANVVLFLGSNLSSFINGATIVVDGGQTVGIN